jgi:hypothetical protein
MSDSTISFDGQIWQIPLAVHSTIRARLRDKIWKRRSAGPFQRDDRVTKRWKLRFTNLVRKFRFDRCRTYGHQEQFTASWLVCSESSVHKMFIVFGKDFLNSDVDVSVVQHVADF